MLKIANSSFPTARLQPSDLIAHWAGVRPLIAPREVKKGTPSNTSRNHQIRTPEPGWIDVAGGKLTTYRLMAQQTVDLIGKHVRTTTLPCRTAQEPILDASECAFSGVIPPAVSREAVEHYCRNEWATHLDDVMLRRSSWHYYHRDSAAIAEQTAGWMSEMLGWTDAQRQEEIARYQQATR